MTTRAVRERFPDVVIWGNMASQHLQEKSADWIREESRRCEAESGGTRYFHGPSNAILHATPLKNVEAMFG